MSSPKKSNVIKAAFDEATKIDKAIAKMNENHAFVLLESKAAILREDPDGAVRFLMPAAFKQKFANLFEFVTVVNKDGTKQQEKRLVVSEWLKSPLRREYDRVIFNPAWNAVTPPDHYNLWHGFAYQPIATGASIDLLLWHIKHIVCHGVEAHYHWVISWMAFIIQHPEIKIGSSLVLQGDKGCGKSILAKYYKQLFGQHGLMLDDPERLLGKFNAHYAKCVFALCEEALWAGDKKCIGKLNSLITAPTMPIEPKGIDMGEVDSFVHAMMIGDTHWTVPVGLRERRYGSWRLLNTYIQNTDYFKALAAQMDAPGAMEAWMHYLMTYEVGDPNLLRNPPKTASLVDQMQRGLPPPEMWWYNFLSRGILPWGCDGAWCAPTDLVFDSFINHAKREGVSRRSTETTIGKQLKNWLPIETGFKKNTKGRYDIIKDREGNFTTIDGATYEFPALQECRKAFDEYTGQACEWDDKEEWTKAYKPQYDPQRHV